MPNAIRWFASQPTAIQSALVSALVGALTALVTVLLTPVLKYQFDLRLETRRVNIQYRAEQQKALRNRLVQYKGLFLEVAEALSDRLWNFYSVQDRGWLTLNGRYHALPTDSGYFARSFAYRILAVVTVARLAERESIFVDLAVVNKSDFQLVVALRMMLRVWTDLDLFQGLPYDSNFAMDHFFIDDLRAMADAFRANTSGEILPTSDAFNASIADANHRFVRVLRYLDGLCRGERRYRFDRVVCAHLVLLAALNGYGYDYQSTSIKDLTVVARMCEHSRVLTNLVSMIRRRKLDSNRSFRRLATVAERVATERRADETATVGSDTAAEEAETND